MESKNLRSTWLEIDTQALAYNLKQVKNHLASDVQIMAIIKADAYGHGMKKVAQEVLKFGVKHLGVATVNEGIRLRRLGIKAPILILGTILKEQINAIIEYDLTANIYNYQLAKEINRLAKEVKVHIKVDTGMGRIGLLPQDAIREIKNISKLEYINITGLFSHFATADTDKDYTLKQLKLFEEIKKEIKKELKEAKIEINNYHLANSAAIINYPASHYNLVRMGIILYGLYPSADLKDKLDLKPVLSWQARIVNLKELGPGQSISYGCSYTTDKVTKIATLAVGYHDGYFRRLSNQAEVICHGRRAKVVGKVCMDQLMVDLTDIPAEIGDQVTLIGCNGQQEITADELAKQAETINYEIVSRIGNRVPKIYL